MSNVLRTIKRGRVKRGNKLIKKLKLNSLEKLQQFIESQGMTISTDSEGRAIVTPREVTPGPRGQGKSDTVEALTDPLVWVDKPADLSPTHPTETAQALAQDEEE